MSNRTFGSPFEMYELSIAGRVASHLKVNVQNVVDAQSYADRGQFTSGDTFRLVSRDGPGSDSTITAA